MTYESERRPSGKSERGVQSDWIIVLHSGKTGRRDDIHSRIFLLVDRRVVFDLLVVRDSSRRVDSPGEVEVEIFRPLWILS